MGRKVHPYGFRLKIIRDWNARWYADGAKYGEQLHEDFAIRDYIRREHSNAGVSKIEIERQVNQVQVTLHTARPGIIIGKKGATVKELRQGLEKLTGKKIKVEVEEIASPDLDAQLVAENVAGRLSGAEMARREWVREGRVPLQTLRADIDHGFAEALTTFGQIGVKVWIYKGEVLTEEETEPTGF